MKRSLTAALLSTALLGGTCGTARAGDFGIGLNLDFSWFGSKSPSCEGGYGSSPDGNGSCSSCTNSLWGGRKCFVPGWSSKYPRPVMYGGLFTVMSQQAAYPPPYPAYGYAPYPGTYGGYGWVPPPVPVQAKQGISTVPPPEPAGALPSGPKK